MWVPNFAVYKMSKFLHDNEDKKDNADDAKAIAKPRVFSKNSQDNNTILILTRSSILDRLVKR